MNKRVRDLNKNERTLSMSNIWADVMRCGVHFLVKHSDGLAPSVVVEAAGVPTASAAEWGGGGGGIAPRSSTGVESARNGAATGVEGTLKPSVLVAGTFATVVEVAISVVSASSLCSK
jgi:hypothetical protein